MRPLRELDRATAARVRGVVFDVDDTVTRGGRLEVEALSAMYALAARGLLLVAVTGRPLGWVDVMARQWPIHLGVGENGAGWVWTEGLCVHHGYFDPPERRAAQARLLEEVRRLVRAEVPEALEADDQGARRCDLAFDVGEQHTLPPNRVAALVSAIERAGARASVSSVHAHAIPGGWDKALGVERAIGEALGIDLAPEIGRFVFVGDSGNDAAAFARFPLAVGVANVREHLARLPIPPTYVTDADRGRGFAELARHLLDLLD